MEEGTRRGIRPVVLVIMDGWGDAPPGPGNAVTLATTPTVDRLCATAARSELTPFGREVGLPDGQMGNSEVGHLNIGAGRVVYQTLTRIDRAIEDGSFFRNPVLLDAVRAAKERHATLHLLGLIGPGGVHAQDAHLLALLRLAEAEGLANVAIHAFLDGRDTPPESARGYMERLETEIGRIGVGRVATVSGRYYAMDRDERWDRVRMAYDAITRGTGARAETPDAAIARSYAAGVTDEFVVPTVIVGADGMPVGTARDGDVAIFFNFRSDRARELSHALVDEQFDGFPRAVPPQITFLTMTEYAADLPVAGVAFPTENIVAPLAAVLAAHGLAQFHAAETEKYPHVTFFFNGGREEPFPDEERRLVPSPKVATYDLQPEMSALAVADAVVAAILSGRYAFILVNFANADMVGHTGVLPAAIAAVATVDDCVGQILTALEQTGGAALVTADHGNAEEMIAPDGTPMTAHTMNRVPCFLTGPGVPPEMRLRPHGRLADIAPTVLHLLGLAPPAEMTGESLIA
ncbi:MAG: 2,3-bisphosphoglycerate-independent phosphoglycerate mutase [Thermomicrobia bacterium]|nr:2,3-bisphosphoglycerate-independent phosphoglycerate mutase [Thermomicrobia bacterium]MCA1722817.1 2,3-bisphosphoglycerate-independent phosphoglycerate mutase [Thermomicrobia bacterium]